MPLTLGIELRSDDLPSVAGLELGAEGEGSERAVGLDLGDSEGEEDDGQGQRRPGCLAVGVELGSEDDDGDGQPGAASSNEPCPRGRGLQDGAAQCPRGRGSAEDAAHHGPPLKRPRETPPAKATTSLAECFAWAPEAVRALYHEYGATLQTRLSARRWTISTHFSGLGTVDVACDMLRSASARVLRSPDALRVEVCTSCERNPSLQRVLAERGEGCVFPDVFARLQVGDARDALVAEACECRKHKAVCPVSRTVLEVSGSPCRPWSRANNGKQRGEEHPDFQVFLAWARLMRHDRPAIIIHENVVGFPAEILGQQFEGLYDITRLRVTPEDVGFGFIERHRVYDVLTRRGEVSVPSLAEVYAKVRRHLAKDVSAWPHFLFMATPGELEAELSERPVHGLVPEESPFVQRLTDRQRGFLNGYKEMWVARHGVAPEECPGCVFDLGDSPEYSGLRRRMTIPTLRARASHFWSPHLARWMLPREKAACMGVPVYGELAQAAGTCVDPHAGASATGNAMHVANVGAVILAVMCSAEWA